MLLKSWPFPLLSRSEGQNYQFEKKVPEISWCVRMLTAASAKLIRMLLFKHLMGPLLWQLFLTLTSLPSILPTPPELLSCYKRKSRAFGWSVSTKTVFYGAQLCFFPSQDTCSAPCGLGQYPNSLGSLMLGLLVEPSILNPGIWTVILWNNWFPVLWGLHRRGGGNMQKCFPGHFLPSTPSLLKIQHADHGGGWVPFQC